MPKKKTTEQFQKELNSLYGDEYTLLSEYDGCFSKITYIHNICNTKNEIIANNIFKSGCHCRKCNSYNTATRNKNCNKIKHSNRLTNEEFLKKKHEVDPNEEYTFLENYITSNTKIKVIHNVCGNIYYVSPNKFLQGRRCPKHRMNGILSYIDDKKLNIEKCQNNIDCLYGKNIWKVINFDFNTKYITIERCNCKKQKTIKYNNLISNISDCKYCNNKYRINKESELIDYCNNNDIILLSSYKLSRIKCMFLCKKCNNIWYSTPSNIKRNYGCPYCCESKMEKRTRIFLNNNNIQYTFQKTFKDCTYIGLLKFDFFIDSINLLIELDGKQHYDAVEWFGGKEELIIQQKRDKIKNEFCESNNINLLRIPYYEYNNIEDILKKELIKYGIRCS